MLSVTKTSKSSLLPTERSILTFSQALHQLLLNQTALEQKLETILLFLETKVVLNPAIASLQKSVNDLTTSQSQIAALVAAAVTLTATNTSLQAALAAAQAAGLDPDSIAAIQAASDAIEGVAAANAAIVVPSAVSETTPSLPA